MANLRFARIVPRVTAFVFVLTAVACTVSTSSNNSSSSSSSGGSSGGSSGTPDVDGSDDDGGACVLPARSGEGCAGGVGNAPWCRDNREPFGIADSAAATDSGAADTGADSGAGPLTVICTTGTSSLPPGSGPEIGGRAFDCKWTEGSSTMTCRCSVSTNPTASSPDGGSQLVTFSVAQTTPPTDGEFEELWKSRCCGGDFCEQFDGAGPFDAPAD